MHFSDDDLRAMFETGQRIAFAIVGQKGAKLSREAVAQAIDGDVATARKLVEPVDYRTITS